MGLYSTFQFLGAFFGGVAGGWLLAWSDSATALLVAGAVGLVWAGVLQFVTKRFFPTGAVG